MTLTEAQHTALESLCERYKATFNPAHYLPAFDLPEGWVSGWVGGPDHGLGRTGDGEWVRTPTTTIYVGCSPNGEVSS